MIMAKVLFRSSITVNMDPANVYRELMYCSSKVPVLIRLT